MISTRVRRIQDAVKGPVTPEELTYIESLVRQARGETQGYGGVFGEIQKIINQNGGKVGGLIRVLQQTQNMVGYLPVPVIKTISRDLKVPLSEVYGIISFYHFFSMQPKGKYVIQVCMGTSCYVKGGQKIMDKLKKDWSLEPGGITQDSRFSLEVVRCLGACGLSPAIAIGKDIHGRVKSGNLNSILEAYD